MVVCKHRKQMHAVTFNAARPLFSSVPQLASCCFVDFSYVWKKFDAFCFFFTSHSLRDAFVRPQKETRECLSNT